MNGPATTGDDPLLSPRAVLAWTLFSLAAGSVNGAAFMACRSFVTHVTGTITNVGIDAGNPALVAEYLLVFVMFIIGAMVSVLLHETVSPSSRALVILPFLAVAIVLVGVALAGSAGVFGPFGARNTETRGAFALLALLAGAMGMQNASVALATSNAVRTTHLTGPATDFAGNVVRAALGRGLGTSREARWAGLRFVKIFAFAVGAGIAARYSTHFEYRIFNVPAAFVILGVGFSVTRDKDDEVTQTDAETESREA